MVDQVPQRPAEGKRRSKRRLDPATGISLREPFAEDNIINVASNTLRWSRWLGLELRRPFFNARARARRYRDWPTLLRQKYKFIEDESPLLGDAIAKTMLNGRDFSQQDLVKFHKLRDAKNTSYLIVHGLSILPLINFFPLDEVFPEKHNDTEYMLGRKYGVEMDREKYREGDKKRLDAKRQYMNKRLELTDYLICGVARFLNCIVQPRYKEHPLALNMLTDPSEQQQGDLDNIDMALRFHQSTVEKKLPKPHEAISYGEIGSLYRVYVCVKNTLRIPIYLVPVKELIDEHLCRFNPQRKAEILKTLETGQFERIGPRSPVDEDLGDIGSSPILRDMGNGDRIMSFDPERVKAYGKQSAEEAAVFELREAIRRARRDAIRIVLKPGEFLIVDNYRALISRREYLPGTWKDILHMWRTTWYWSKSLARWRPKFLEGRTYQEGSSGANEDEDEDDKIVAFWPFRPQRWLRTYYLFRAKTEEDLLDEAICGKRKKWKVK